MGANDPNKAHELIDRLSDLSAQDQKAQAYLAALKSEISSRDSAGEDLQQELASYKEAYDKLTAPANRIGVVLKLLEDGQALVVLGDTEYAAVIDPAMVEPEALEVGRRVRLNDAYAIVGVMEDSEAGNLIRVAEVMEDGRLRVGGESPGAPTRLISSADSLDTESIRSGDEVMLDSSGRIAREHFPKQEASELFIEETPDAGWKDVGGQESALRMIRDSIEQPILYPEIYSKFDKKPVKGILLYGPPGCGKTLIGKAIASSLAKEYSERKGEEVKECFLHISGPKILNMWLGETERMVRDIFAAAREKSKEGRIVVVFIDEAESILRTRSGGKWLNISNTVVPQFCAEMDGLVELNNVVLIITSNRPDYIDPAILRPERIDRRIKITRPNRDGAKDILSIHFDENLPIDKAEIKKHDGEPSCARIALIEGVLAHLWREDKATEHLTVRRKSGSSETLYWRDLVSGALLKSIVDRAKDSAIRRAISEPGADHGLRLADLTAAVDAEYSENEIFPKSDVLEDWLKLIDIEPESVAAVKPIRAQPEQGFGRVV